MAAMRRFICYDCNETFEVPYGTGGAGATMTCPNCGGSNVHRAEDDRGYSRQRTTGGAGAARGPAGRGPGPGGRGRGGSGRGPRWA